MVNDGLIINGGIITEPVVHTLSHSKLNTYNSCPWKYKLKYIDKIREHKPSIHAIFGTVTHILIQEWLDTIYSKTEREGLKIHINQRVSELLKIELHKESEKVNGKSLDEFFSKEEVLEFYQQTVDMIYWLRKNRSKYFQLKKTKLVGIEIPLDCNYTYNGNTILFNGYIDVVFYNEVLDKYIVIDFKTSKSGWDANKKKDPMKKSQVHFYKHFYSQKLGVDINKVDVEFFILKRQPYQFEDMPLKYVQEFKPAAGSVSIKRSLSQIHTYMDNVFSEEPKFPKVSSDCRWCEYDNETHCPKKERMSLIDLQKQIIIKNNKNKKELV